MGEYADEYALVLFSVLLDIAFFQSVSGLLQLIRTLKPKNPLLELQSAPGLMLLQEFKELRNLFHRSGMDRVYKFRDLVVALQCCGFP